MEGEPDQREEGQTSVGQPTIVAIPQQTTNSTDKLLQYEEIQALSKLNENEDDDDDNDGGEKKGIVGGLTRYQGIIICVIVVIIGWALVQFLASLVGIACDFPGASLLLPFCKGHSVCGVASSICNGVSGLARDAFHTTETIGRTLVHGLICIFSLFSHCGSEAPPPPSIFGWFTAPPFTTVDIDAGTVTCSDPTGDTCQWPLGASGTIHATVHCRPSTCASRANLTDPEKVAAVANTIKARQAAGFQCPWDPTFTISPAIINNHETLQQKLLACIDCWPACTAEQTSGDCLCHLVCFLPDGYVSYGVQERKDINDLDSICIAYSKLLALPTSEARRILAPFMQTLAPRCGSIVTLNVTRFIEFTLERNGCNSGAGN